jgi:hypothetical protein
MLNSFSVRVGTMKCAMRYKSAPGGPTIWACRSGKYEVKSRRRVRVALPLCLGGKRLLWAEFQKKMQYRGDVVRVHLAGVPLPSLRIVSASHVGAIYNKGELTPVFVPTLLHSPFSPVYCTRYSKNTKTLSIASIRLSKSLSVREDRLFLANSTETGSSFNNNCGINMRKRRFNNRAIQPKVHEIPRDGPSTFSLRII